ncbi:hypothetical protein [Streptomyces sp. NPDC017993]|uniref:hypothetical protein n=1 Tax=Streptomyces sp. NPDC017993 TaxID=3365027 RepID=UPI0037B6368E
MTTLRVEHSVTDFDLWKAWFDRFSEFRQQSGVCGYRVQRAVGDPQYVVFDLDFETTDAAVRFFVLLQTKVWSSSESAPALVGTPQAKILDSVEERSAA